MKVYYLLLECKPYITNPESKKVNGGYINCWVKTTDQANAIAKAVEYVNSQEWEVENIEEIYIVKRERYTKSPESLEGYDSAINFGVGAVFYTWSK